MKKYFLAFVLIISLILPLFSACGSNDNTHTTLPTVNETTENTVSDNSEDKTEENSDTDGSSSTIGTQTSASTDEGDTTTEDSRENVIDTSLDITETTSASSEIDPETSALHTMDTTETTKSSDTDESSDSEKVTEDTREFEISVADGKALVSTSHGIGYLATGYDGITDNGFAFDSGLVLELGDSFDESFNRFTMKYRSTAPLKIYLTYTENGSETEEYYFLEAGENEFSGLTTSFLSKALGKSLGSIRIDTCENKTAEFILLALSTETIDVPDKTYYIIGSKYTLGIDLSWGGSISHVSDNDCPINGVTNLCNMHDEGRLIQQSYYGLNYHEEEYVDGGYVGEEGRPYNPVQGGDEDQYDSRLIDLVIEDDYVYIKAQALDWALSNSLTPSYMENKYVVEDEYIYVYNRFVDFSGWEHPYKDQELPAVYTINYLDTFVWYDGAKPWTGDTLSSITDWSNVDPGSNKASYYVKLKSPNTETWGALINSEANYGLGVYVPNIDKFLAMRYMSGLNGYMSGEGNPCSYFSPLNEHPIVSYRPLEYSYLIAVGSIEEIREVFTEHKDFDDNKDLNIKHSARDPYYEGSMDNIDLSGEQGIHVISQPHSTDVSYDTVHSAIKLNVNDNDPYFSFDFDSSPNQLLSDNYSYIEIDYMIPTANVKSSYSCQLFLCAGEVTSPTGKSSVSCNLIKDGVFHTLRVPVADLDFWNGIIHTVRFDFFNESDVGDIMYIKAFRLTDSSPLDDMSVIDFGAQNSTDFISKTSTTTVGFDNTSNAVKLTATDGTDPSVTIDYSISSNVLSADEYGKISITYMIPTANSKEEYVCEIFLCTGDVKNATGGKSTSFSLTADGEFHTQIIDLSGCDFWTGDINKIRLDYFTNCDADDEFYLKNFSFISEP